MFYALKLKQQIFFFALLFIVSALICSLIRILLFDFPFVPTNFSDFFNIIKNTVLFSIILVFILENQIVISKLWKRFPRLNSIVCPDLNGEYSVKTNSNWNIQEKMLTCINGGQYEIANSGQDISNYAVTGTIIVKMGFFSLSVKYKPAERGESRSLSTVIASSIKKSAITRDFELVYTYQASVNQPNKDTDEQCYYGSAILTIDNECRRPKLLSGVYWTNRSWAKGINTAGRIEIDRIS